MNADVLQIKVRCRMIREGDLEEVTDLLLQGFPGRNRRYWSTGFERLRASPCPPNVPRFGYLIETEGRIVGVILLLFTALEAQGRLSLRCNISSWYVQPQFRMHASMLIFYALKLRAVTYLNVSPASHTWATVEAQGFTRYTAGQFIGIPALRAGGGATKIHRLRAESPPGLLAEVQDRQLLIDHAAMGCVSLVVEAPDGLHPFSFVPYRMRSGRVPLPGLQLIYCRSFDDYRRFAGQIGRYTLLRGIPFVIHDGDGPEPGMLGYYRAGMGPKYFRGPDRPRRGDLAYTERVIFGP